MPAAARNPEMSLNPDLDPHPAAGKQLTCLSNIDKK
jgi:hypothetical protein